MARSVRSYCPLRAIRVDARYLAPKNPVISISFEWQLLAARILVIALLYLFLLQIARVTLRELSALAHLDAEPHQPKGAFGDAYLELVEPANSSYSPGTIFHLNPLTVLGRHPDCDIAVADTSVSAEHAEITANGSGWWIRDLGSTNGTLINGSEVTFPTQLKTGDILQCGRVKFRVVC